MKRFGTLALSLTAMIALCLINDLGVPATGPLSALLGLATLATGASASICMDRILAHV